MGASLSLQIGQEFILLSEIRVTFESFVVDVDLSVGRDETALRGDSEGIDFGDLTVVLPEDIVKLTKDSGPLGEDLPFQTSPPNDICGLIRTDPPSNIHEFLDDLIWISPSQLFDIDPSLAARQNHSLALTPLDRYSQVDFAGNIDFLLDQEASHRKASDLGPQEFLYIRLELSIVFGELNASSLPPSPDKDLRFDHNRAKVPK